MIELVLVDFDDTLVDTGPKFQNARRSLLALMAEQGFDANAAHHMLYHEVDPPMRVKYGLGPRRMEHAFAETYRRLCETAGTPFDHDVAEYAAGLGRACYGSPSAFDGALDALRRLAAVHPTAIYTQSGDEEYQRSCIHTTGIGEILAHDRIAVCGRKDVDMFVETLRRYEVERVDRAWMIGNSMRSDINPALEAGANAILVETEDPWEYDLVDAVSDRFHRAGSFVEAVDLLLR